METRNESLTMYLLCTALTVIVFGLGYFCGKNTESNAAGATLNNSNSISFKPSQTNVRSESLQRQPLQRKAALLV